MSRRQTRQEFEQFLAKKDVRGMDDICAAGQGAAQGFALQVHQEFLRQWMLKKQASVPKALLLYHQIGSGKTCTSIVMAMQWLKSNPQGRVRVLLPARLRTNYWDELLSPCTMNEYFTRQQYEAYQNPKATAKERHALRRQLMEAVGARFEVMSFDAFRKAAIASEDLRAWVDDFTRDTFVVIDEVHNMLASGYKEQMYEEMKANNRVLHRSKFVNAMLFRYFVSHAHKTSKMIFLSATPVFDNAGQFVELVRVLDPTYVPRAHDMLSDAVARLRGRVSYFPGISPNAYPTVTHVRHDVRATGHHAQVLVDLVNKRGRIDPGDPGEDDADTFMVKERMAGVAIMPPPGDPFTPSPAKIARVVRQPGLYAPKLRLLLKLLTEERGKHVVYTSFVAMGVDVVVALLRARGYVDIHDVAAGRAQAKPYKVYAVWDGRANDKQKADIKSVINAKDNIDGRHLRVLVGSPSIREGISIKHVQHMHVLDPVWNQSTKTQIEGRAIRFCSHSDIPASHPFLKRRVVVHTYCITAGSVTTSDMHIYDTLIPEKHQAVLAAENALKRVAFDYLLFKKLHRDTDSAVRVTRSGRSQVRLSSDVPLLGKKRVPAAVKKNTCPKPRRPVDGRCPDRDSEARPNAHGEPCCYKKKKAPG